MEVPHTTLMMPCLSKYEVGLFKKLTVKFETKFEVKVVKELNGVD